jgi:predicted DNA-binding protein with PD1-like motif
MKYTQATQGRIFIIRLEDGDIVHDAIEQLARTESIKAAAMIILGGADEASTLVVGPKEGRSSTVTPMLHALSGVHEIAGVGTLFPDDEGVPLLHMHMACGRNADTITGCIREGVRVWHVMEVILFELLDTSAIRAFEVETGFKLLQPTHIQAAGTIIP